MPKAINCPVSASNAIPFAVVGPPAAATVDAGEGEAWLLGEVEGKGLGEGIDE